MDQLILAFSYFMDDRLEDHHSNYFAFLVMVDRHDSYHPLALLLLSFSFNLVQLIILLLPLVKNKKQIELQLFSFLSQFYLYS